MGCGSSVPSEARQECESTTQASAPVPGIVQQASSAELDGVRTIVTADTEPPTYTGACDEVLEMNHRAQSTSGVMVESDGPLKPAAALMEEHNSASEADDMPTGSVLGDEALACTRDGCGCADDAPPAKLEPSAWIESLPEERRASEARWLEQLDELQFRVLRMKATEEMHSGKYNDHDEAGTYVCRGCAQPIYSSQHKFKSDHGWPAFADNFEGALTRLGDRRKTEIVCSGCGGHVGHVFRSSRYPKPHHERHCSNSASLCFIPEGVKSS